MPRRICNKNVQENSEAESDNDDIYQEENRDESTSPTLSQSPSQSPSSTPSPSPLPETPPPRRVTRSSTPKVKKAVATTPKTPKTPKTPRAIVTRTQVIKKTTAAGRGNHADADMESVGDTESETGPQLLKTPTTKKPRPRAKKGAVTGGGKAYPEGEVESEGDVKSVTKPAPKKPRARAKGRGAGDQPEEGESDAKPMKTLTPKRSRVKSEKSKAASEQARTPKKPRAPRPKKIMKASTTVAATLPLIASIQENDDGGGSSVGLPSKVSFPLDSLMDGIETYRSAAAVLKTSNWDCGMMAMPLQERNSGGQPHRHGYGTMSRTPTVLLETPTMDGAGRTGQDTTRATHVRSVFSPIIKEEPHSPERAGLIVLADQYQRRSLIFDDNNLFPLPVKTEPRVPEPLESRFITSAPDTWPTTASRLVEQTLDLSTVPPWKRVTVPTPSSSTPSSLARTNNPLSATSMPSAAYLQAPLATIDDVAKTVDKTYDVASQYLLGAMKLTRRALEDQAHAIQFHTVAFQVFGQGLLMTESQCQTLFPQEQFADLATRSVLSLLPSLQVPSASAATPLSTVFAPQAQANTSAQDENLLINVVSNMKGGLESPLAQSGYGSAMPRSCLYSSYIPPSRPLSPTFPSPPSTPTRSPMTAPIPIQHSVGSTVPWLSSSDFANDSVQPSIFAHDRQGFPTTTLPPRSSFSSAQASESLDAPCASVSLSTMMSTENQHSSLHALKEARRKALYEHFQRRRDESATQNGTHDQQRDLTPSQQQESRLVMSTLAGQPECRTQQQQYNQQYNHEVEMGYLKTTAVVGEEARIEDVEPRLMQVQLTSSLWSEVKERSTNLYLRAVKSYEDSRSANRIASESNEQFMEASKRWYALTGHAFPYD
ncbi:hypothetical protein BGX30_005483 [Mortierella sp. GBA39]|nr:hypothetical protein BGX30_005483 [Mortierella sp. GBA39]